MNNLEEWQDAHPIIKTAWQNWDPHFEALTSDTGEKMIALFLLHDTNIEWRIYQEAPQEVLEDLADYMEDAKEELLERVNYKLDEKSTITERLAEKMTAELRKAIKEYEARRNATTSVLTYNMLFYSEWSAQPREVLEIEYESGEN